MSWENIVELLEARVEEIVQKLLDAQMPEPVSAPATPEPAHTSSETSGVIYVDDFITPTDDSHQTAWETARSKAAEENKSVVFKGGEYLLKNMNLHDHCNVVGWGDSTLISIGGVNGPDFFVQFNDDENFDTVGNWRTRQRFGNFHIKGEAKKGMVSINAINSFSIGDLWFDGAKSQNDLVDLSYAFGGSFGLLNFSNSMPENAALMIRRFATTNHFAHVYTGGQYTKYGVIVDGGSFSPKQLTLQSHTQEALWVKSNGRPCVIGDYYGEDNSTDIRLGHSDENKLAVGVSILGGMTGAPSKTTAATFNSRFASLFLDYAFGVEVNKGFRFATSAVAVQGNKIPVWPIVFNRASDVEINEGYYFNVVNGRQNRKLIDDCVILGPGSYRYDSCFVGGVDANTITKRNVKTHP